MQFRQWHIFAFRRAWFIMMQQVRPNHETLTGDGVARNPATLARDLDKFWLMVDVKF